MASKSAQEAQKSVAEIEELLDTADSTLDRLKTLYEQYFMGIQKQAPSFIHSDLERKLRDLTQMNIRNTGLRYRLATLQQKFGSYNSYWRRTLRQIENGTYIRHLTKIGREAVRTGSEIPEEILNAMPKRMREQVLRDRDAAIAMAKRRKQVEESVVEDEPLADEEPAQIADAPPRRDVKTASGAHVLSEDDADIDFNALFSAFDDDAPKKHEPITQQITQPLPRMPEQQSTEIAKTTVLPRIESPAIASATTTAIPRPPVPRLTPTSGIPRPVGQQPSAPVPVASSRPTPDEAIPRPIGQQPSNAVPRPIGQQPSAPVPVASTRPTPASGPVPLPVGHQPSQPAPRPQVPPPAGAIPVGRMTPAGGVPRPVGHQPSQPTTAIPRPVGHQPSQPTTTAIPRPVGQQPSQPTTTAIPRPPTPAGASPVVPPARPTPAAGVPRPVGQQPSQPATVTQPIPRPAMPSQAARPTPIVPGSSAQTGPVPVESMSGPFPRSEKPAAQTTQIPKPPAPPPQQRTQPVQRPTPAAPLKPPPGMSDADVNALHAKYVKAKEMVGEKVDPNSREKLLKTINQTAPKVMQQYNASGVDFSVVVKDNQVIIKAKPKT